MTTRTRAAKTYERLFPEFWVRPDPLLSASHTLECKYMGLYYFSWFYAEALTEVSSEQDAMMFSKKGFHLISSTFP